MKRFVLASFLVVIAFIPVVVSVSPLIRMGRALFTVHAIYNAPISFYGKVIDQNGNPVPGATVQYDVVDKLMAPGSEYHATSDPNGSFSISNIGGAGMVVGVMKDGYDPIDGKSSQSFGYGMGVDEYRKKPPTKDNPAIFVLRKKAPAEPMFVVSSRQYEVDRTGVPTAIDLKTTGTGTDGPDNIQVSILSHEETKDQQGRFNWAFSISVPGGGLVERSDETQFNAPQDGYVPRDEIQVSTTDPSRRWSWTLEKQYFVKLADGRYARVSIRAYVGGRTFIVLESYTNRNPGDRNLEYDPKVQ